MLKRMLTVILVSCLLPVMAYAAWSLNTRNYTTGGSIQVGSAPPQTSTTSVFKSYTTSKPVTIKVTPKSGYIISQVNFNGVIITNPVETSFLVQGPTSQKFFAWYAAFSTSISLTVSVDGNYGGVGSPASFPLVYGTALTAPVVVTYTPASSSYRLSTISGIPSGASQNPAAPLSGQSVSVTFPIGFSSTTNISLVGKFVYTDPVANAGAAQVAYLGKNVLLDGTESQPGDTGISSYSWVQVSGPAVTILNANMAQAHFNAAAEGVYTFSLTVMPGGSTATTSVNTTADVVGLVRTHCHDCHYSINHTLAIGAFNKWSDTKHASYAVVCANCHVGADTGGHPGIVPENICINCHNSNQGSSSMIAVGHMGIVDTKTATCADCHGHDLTPNCTGCHGYPPSALTVALSGHAGTHISSTDCASCHGAGAGSNSNHRNSTVELAKSGAPHFNNITSGMYPASYMTSKSGCPDCHNPNSNNQTIRQQWGASGHGNTTALPWVGKDFKTQNECVRCHTTTGFISYSTGRVTTAWGVATDKTKEVLACNSCHSDVENGVVRTVSPVKPFAADTYINRNIGPSNICMNCHSGRNNGLSITSADFSNQVFIAPHYLTAGSILHGTGGYDFPGQPYAFYSSNSHRVIGIGNSSGTGTAGPCIGCHMTASQKHLFKAVSSVTGDLVGKITTSTCANCHGSSYIYDPTNINNSQTSYNNSLEVLNQTLILRNFPPTTDYPYFQNTNWGTGQSGANTMGAAFNYILLKKEPGGYAHNPGYAKKLLFDSIDYLYNGSITGSIEGALAYLVQINTISQNIADSVSAYKSVSGCTSCHGVPPRTGAHLVHTDGVGAAYGDDGNNSTVTSYRFNCGSCHPMDISKHANGIVDMELFNPAATGTKKSNPANASRTGAGTTTVCLNVYCHSSGQEDSVRKYIDTPQWGGSFSLNKCASCHGDPPSYASGGSDNASANSHYSQNMGNGEGGHLVGLHFDNIRKDPVDSWQPLFPKAGGAGSGSGHGDPATSTTISCPTCHASTVSLPSMQSAPGTVFACASCHGLQPAAVIADKSMHVNGARDVYFMTGTFRSRAQIRLDNFTSVIKPLGWTRNNGYKTLDSFDSVPFSGSYNPADKSCVTACHLNQPAKWGDTALNCISCHADL